MAPKIKSQTEKNQTLIRLMMILFSVMVASSISGCSQSSRSIPEELRGKYATNDPEYEDQFFELSSELIFLGFAGGKYKYYRVERVEKEIFDNRILFTILCTNEDEGEEFNFSFFTDLAGGGILHFKNKPQVAWEKQKTEISYNDNSDTTIQH